MTTKQYLSLEIKLNKHKPVFLHLNKKMNKLIANTYKKL
jgi:hypothetical protein